MSGVVPWTTSVTLEALIDDAVMASLKVAVMFAATATPVAPAAGEVVVTVGGVVSGGGAPPPPGGGAVGPPPRALRVPSPAPGGPKREGVRRVALVRRALRAGPWAPAS